MHDCSDSSPESRTHKGGQGDVPIDGAPEPIHHPKIPNYEAIRQIARRIWKASGGSPQVDATDLANECYLRVAHAAKSMGSDQSLGLAYCVTTIRRLLIDLVRKDQIRVRGRRFTIIMENLTARQDDPMVIDLLELDGALEELEEVDARQARIVELMFLMGLSRPAIADTLDCSVRTVAREWSLARAWLQVRLTAR